MPSFEVTVDEAAIDHLFNGLNENLDRAVRPAAQAGAQVLYEAVKLNVARVGKITGNLATSIFQAYSDHSSSPGVAVYAISWNSKKAPHGRLVEFGHIQKFKVYLGKDGKWYTNKDAPLSAPVQVGAKPFIRPAMAQFGKAADAMERELLNRVARRSE